MDILTMQLDCLQGLGAMSMQWGAWGGTGMAIKNDLLPRIIKSGLGVLAPDAGVFALAAALSLLPSPAQLVVSPFEWAKLMQGATHVFPVFSEYATHIKPHGPLPSTAARTPAVHTRPTGMQRDQLTRASGQAVHARQAVMRPQAAEVSRQAVLSERVTALVTEIMGKGVDARQPLMEAGLDSLGAVELRTRLGQQLEQELPATIVFDYPTVDQLAAYMSSLAIVSTAELGPEVS